MKNKVISINLLKKEEVDFLEKFVNWALTIGRFVVILTEGIALSAFLYRFTLDRQVIDLHDEISQKQAIVKFLKPNEDNYRNIQSRLLFVSKIEASAKNMTNNLKETIDSSPDNFLISDIHMSGNNLSIQASARSLYSLTDFLNTLKNNPKIKIVSLDKIENRTSESLIIVEISAVYEN